MWVIARSTDRYYPTLSVGETNLFDEEVWSYY
jgi:hypothetical protein